MNKNWFKYLGYFMLIFGLISLDAYVGRQQSLYRAVNFELNFFYYFTTMLIRMSIGFSLALEYIVNEFKKEGPWQVNLPKIVLIVLPSLYFSLILLFSKFPSTVFFRTIFVKTVFIFLKFGYDFVFIFQLMLGYFLITSFYKQDKAIEKENIL